MHYKNIREEELKNKVGQDYFADYDTTQIVGNIDFCVIPKVKKVLSLGEDLGEDKHSLLWAEAKTGNFDVIAMFAQLILTIGKARTFDKSLPPAFLGAFDFQKIAFVPFEKVQHLFFKNDFNWNVTASNHDTKEFNEIRQLIENILQSDTYLYEFGKDDHELKFFIKNNMAHATDTQRIQIDKNNFVPIYLRWLEQVKPLINFDFAEGKKQNILDSDFYLADLFVDDHNTTNIDDDTPSKDELFVVFKNGHYEIAKENLKSLFNASIDIKDKQAYEQFWKRYKRPPLVAYQNYIIERRDLLVPQDIRERKGAFFTPRPWVELSQKYLADVLGDQWQEDYYIWDCAAGTGNLLTGLTNKYHIWASTLDQADVKVMHDRIAHGANLLENHVFQFDFLNDDFTKLPQPLQDILNDEEKRKKLVIYINPPYADSNGLVSKNRTNIQNTKVFNKYNSHLEKSSSELYAQFFIRIYIEIPDCILAEFSKLKLLNGTNSIAFRNNFKARLNKLFIVPANTFDNVNGDFPIGFFIWDLKVKEKFSEFNSDVYDSTSEFIGNKFLYSYDDKKGRINNWLEQYKQKKDSSRIGVLMADAPDFQHSKLVCFRSDIPKGHGIVFTFNEKNLINASIYLATRHCIEPIWLNDRDQFLFPNENWQTDLEFQNDCLAFTLFHGQNRITSSEGTNHWIPFTEQEVNAREKFESHFMTDFIKGKIKPEATQDLFSSPQTLSGFETRKELAFSAAAQAVFEAGRNLWQYYHAQHGANPNASLYDIREHFQGRNEAGRMNAKSTDVTYMQYIGNLREQLNHLATKIAPKVYEYGFLKE